MRILILSCNTGGGHNTAARAIMEAAKARGHETTMLDYLSLLNQMASDVISNSYINMARFSPHFFGMIYGAGMKLSTVRRYSPVYYANIPFAKKLGAYLATNHYDAVVMTHLFAAQGLTYLKNKRVQVPLSVAIATDYTCQPFWEELNCDYYVLPHEDLIREYVDRGLPRERLKPLGIPVSARFSNETDSRKDARAALGLPSDAPIFLVMGGSMGSGHILTFTEKLLQAAENGFVTVICGSNARLLGTLQERFGKEERLRLIGYTDQVAQYMAACDVLYTKPGGLTSTEALVQGVPLIHTAPIPGCESANSRFFEEHGLSYSARSIDEQIAYGCELAHNAARQKAMALNQALYARPDAAAKVIELIENESAPWRM